MFNLVKCFDWECLAASIFWVELPALKAGREEGSMCRQHQLVAAVSWALAAIIQDIQCFLWLCWRESSDMSDTYFEILQRSCSSGNYIPSGRQLPRTPPLTNVTRQLDFTNSEEPEQNMEVHKCFGVFFNQTTSLTWPISVCAFINRMVSEIKTKVTTKGRQIQVINSFVLDPLKMIQILNVPIWILTGV